MQLFEIFENLIHSLHAKCWSTKIRKNKKIKNKEKINKNKNQENVTHYSLSKDSKSCIHSVEVQK